MSNAQGIGAPKGGRVHWFWLNSDKYISAHYENCGLYDYHEYFLKRKDLKADETERQDYISVTHPSKRSHWYLGYYSRKTQRVSVKAFATSQKAADYAHKQALRNDFLPEDSATEQPGNPTNGANPSTPTGVKMHLFRRYLSKYLENRYTINNLYAYDEYFIERKAYIKTEKLKQDFFFVTHPSKRSHWQVMYFTFKTKRVTHKSFKTAKRAAEYVNAQAWVNGFLIEILQNKPMQDRPIKKPAQKTREKNKRV